MLLSLLGKLLSQMTSFDHQFMTSRWWWWWWCKRNGSVMFSLPLLHFSMFFLPTQSLIKKSSIIHVSLALFPFTLYSDNFFHSIFKKHSNFFLRRYLLCCYELNIFFSFSTTSMAILFYFLADFFLSLHRAKHYNLFFCYSYC